MRIGNLALPAGLACALAPAGAAQAQYYAYSYLTFDQLDTPGDRVVAVRAGEPILRVKAYGPAAVRLDEDVVLPPDISAKAALAPGTALKAGTILTATHPDSRRYCLPMHASGLGLAAPCLVDADVDGKLEQVMKAGFASARVRGVSISAKGEVVGTSYRAVGALAVPVGYTPVDYKSGIPATGTLTWAWNNKPPRAPGEPASFGLMVRFADARGPMSVPIVYTFTGEPMTVDYYGMQVRVLGMDENKALRLKVESLQFGRSAALWFFDRKYPLVIYIPHL